MSTNEKPSFIKLDDTRIKLNNIKDYGISKTEYERGIFNIDYCAYFVESRLFFDDFVLKKAAGQYNIDIPLQGSPDVAFPQGAEENFWLEVQRFYKGKLYVCQIINSECGNDFTVGYVVFKDKNHFKRFVSNSRPKKSAYNAMENIYYSAEVRKKDLCQYQEITRRKISIEYLYITTYQKDNYRFYQDKVDFDVHEKLKLLDSYLSI